MSYGPPKLGCARRHNCHSAQKEWRPPRTSSVTSWRSGSSQSLTLRHSHVATRPLGVAIALSRFEVHGKFRTLPVTDVRTLIIHFTFLPTTPTVNFKCLPQNSKGVAIQAASRDKCEVICFCAEHLTSDAWNFATRKWRSPLSGWHVRWTGPILATSTSFRASDGRYFIS